MSTDFTSAIAEFGRLMGIEGLEPGGDATICLSVGEELKLDIHASPEEALIILSRALPFATGNLLLAQLQRCDRQQTHDWVPQLGLVGLGAECELLMIDRLPSAQLTGAQLLQAFDRLAEWMHSSRELA